MIDVTDTKAKVVAGNSQFLTTKNCQTLKKYFGIFTPKQDTIIEAMSNQINI